MNILEEMPIAIFHCFMEISIANVDTVGIPFGLAATRGHGKTPSITPDPLKEVSGGLPPLRGD